MSLGSIIDSIRDGEEPDLEPLATLITQTQNALYLHADGPVLQVTRNVWIFLDLPIQFKEVMTPETLTKFSRGLDTQERFYTFWQISIVTKK